MAKAPAFQFYVKDWLSDPLLKMVTHQTKGIWIDLLCFLWESPDRGELNGTKEQFQKMLGCNAPEFDQFINEASVTHFANVTNCNGLVTVRNRRMFREEKERKNTRLRVSRFRSNAQSNAPCNGDVTVPSSSSSPLKENIKEKKRVTLPDSEWLKELQNKPCYFHLTIETEFEKCQTWFKEKNIIVSRSRFLNWLNRSQFQSKPIQKEDPYKNYEYVKGEPK